MSSEEQPPKPEHSGISAFWAELKRRKVMRVGITYAVVAWIIIQVAATTFASFGIPEWAFRFVVIMLCIFFPVAIILAWAFELTPEGIKTTKAAQAERGDVPVSKKQQRKRNWMALGFAAAAPTVIFGALAVFFYFRSDPSSLDTRPSSPGLVESDKSIAVLPLANMSPDPDNAFFADGVQEDILTNLSKIDELIVISRSSTLQFRNPDRNLKQVGTELGVRYLVEGSVRRAGDRVRVTVQLIDGTTDEHVWAETYDRSLDDIFAIQSEVAKTIADKLQAVLSPVEIARIDYRPTESQEAYDNWIKYMQLLENSTRRWDEKAAYLERAVELDPGFSEAWAQLAVEYLFWGMNRRDEDMMEKGHRTLEKAVKMKKDSPEVLTSQGYFAMVGSRRDWDKAIGFSMEALAIEPNHLIALQALAFCYQATGRKSEAIYYSEKALQVDPLSTRANESLFKIYLRAQQWDKALALGRKILARSERSGENDQIDHWRRSLANVPYLEDGDLSAHIEVIEAMPDFSDDPGLAAYHALLVRDLPKALKLLEEGAGVPGFTNRVQYGVSNMLISDATLRLLLLWELGEHDKLQSYIRTYRSNFEDSPQNLAIADAVEGRPEQIEAHLAELLDWLNDEDAALWNFYGRIDLAIAYLVSGDEDTAFEHLEAASRMEYPQAHLNRGLNLLFIFDRLRGNPRFDKLLEE